MHLCIYGFSNIHSNFLFSNSFETVTTSDNLDWLSIIFSIRSNIFVWVSSSEALINHQSIWQTIWIALYDRMRCISSQQLKRIKSLCKQKISFLTLFTSLWMQRYWLFEYVTPIIDLNHCAISHATLLFREKNMPDNSDPTKMRHAKRESITILFLQERLFVQAIDWKSISALLRSPLSTWFFSSIRLKNISFGTTPIVENDKRRWS